MRYSPTKKGSNYGDLQHEINKARLNYVQNGSPRTTKQVFDIDMGRSGFGKCTEAMSEHNEGLRSRCHGWSLATNGSVTLYNYQDVPTFLQGNPYVKGGYTAMLSLHMCVKRSVNLR